MAEMQMTYKYQAPIMQREQNLFLEEYYCGTDTRIYVDGDEQKEVNYISYQLGEQLKPLYGYASRTWDSVAVGTRIVTGILKIPIKNPSSNSDLNEYKPEYMPSTKDEIEASNKKSEEEKDKIEWIDSTKKPETDDSSSGGSSETDKKINDPDIIMKYQKKLKKLGYDVDQTGVYDSKTNTAIMDFCKDNNLRSDHIKFDKTVRDEIRASAEENTVYVMVSKAKGYTSPSSLSDVVRDNLFEGMPLKVIAKKGDWYYVKTNDVSVGAKKFWVSSFVVQEG